jgi:hypothetical protein
MAAVDTKFNWYGKEVSLILDGAAEELLTAAAFQGEALIKTDVDLPVDTGFMRNAVYAIGTESHRDKAVADALAVANRELAPEPDVPDGEAAIHAAASYTIYQENKHNFMYHGLERLARDMGGIVSAVEKTL